MTNLPAQLRERAGMLMQETRFDSGSPWTSDLLRQAADEIEKTRVAAEGLWTLLDGIDTLDDMCKENDAAYREMARRIQRRRHNMMVTDGHDLFMPHERPDLIKPDPEYD